MPQTVLRGPDGGPAIDQATGMPLTMEEMLRRNGIVAMGNTVSMMGPSGTPSAAQSAPTPTSGPGSAVQAAMSRRSGNAGVSPSANPNASAATDVDADTDPAIKQLADTNTDPSVVDMLEKAGLIAAGTAAAYGAYRLAKGLGGSGASAADPVTGAVDSNYTPRPVEDGHFTDINDPALAAPDKRLPTPAKRIGDASKRALASRGNVAAQIEGGQPMQRIGQTRALPNNGRTATAQAMAARAAQGGPTDVGTIAGVPPVRTINEAPESGLARTLGMPMELLRTLKANPGLMRTLSRVP